MIEPVTNPAAPASAVNDVTPKVMMKAAPNDEQVAERLAHGECEGIEICLRPDDIASSTAVERAISAIARYRHATQFATAELPVSWPNRAFVSVDTLDRHARTGIERSVEVAAGIGAEAITAHLFIPLAESQIAAGWDEDTNAVSNFLEFFVTACQHAGIRPLVENVPPVLRMRTGGAFYSPIGGHWRDLLRWKSELPDLGFTFDVSHAALYGTFARCYPYFFGDEYDELSIDAYVSRLQPSLVVAHVSNASGVLGEGLGYRSGQLDLDPIVERLCQDTMYIVAEIAELDPLRSEAMRDAYSEILRVRRGLIVEPAVELGVDRELSSTPPVIACRALADADRSTMRVPAGTGRAERGWERTTARTGAALAASAPRISEWDWSDVLGKRDPAPAVAALEDALRGERIMITGGGGSIGQALRDFLVPFGPSALAIIDSHERSLVQASRTCFAPDSTCTTYSLCDVRDARRIWQEIRAQQPSIIFHLAAYKHVDWAERCEDECLTTNVIGACNVLAAAEAAEVQTVVVASSDKATTASNLYGITKALVERLVQRYAGRSRACRVALRYVNVLGSSGSASELFANQAVQGIPLTITSRAMERYWMTLPHAALFTALGVVLARHGSTVAVPSDVSLLSVDELASRIWRSAGHADPPRVAVVGVRDGERMREELTRCDEQLADVLFPGIVGVEPTTIDLDRQIADRTVQASVGDWLDELIGSRAEISAGGGVA